MLTRSLLRNPSHCRGTAAATGAVKSSLARGLRLCLRLLRMFRSMQATRREQALSIQHAQDMVLRCRCARERLLCCGRGHDRAFSFVLSATGRAHGVARASVPRSVWCRLKREMQRLCALLRDLVDKACDSAQMQETMIRRLQAVSADSIGITDVHDDTLSDLRRMLEARRAMEEAERKMKLAEIAAVEMQMSELIHSNGPKH